MPLRGGPPPELGLGGVGQQAAPQVPGLLQMAQSAMDGGGGAPQTFAGAGPQAQQYENAWDNPANWGAPPPMNPNLNKDNFLQNPGFFPGGFQPGGRGDPNGKFFSMKDYYQQYYDKFGLQAPEYMPGGQEDRHINTLNPALLGGARGPAEQGSFMYLGHQISPSQYIYDQNVGKNPPAGGEGGGNWSPIRRIQGLGPANPASFIHGSGFVTGLPGQIENWAGGQPYWT